MNQDPQNTSRRNFLYDVGLTAVGVTLLSSFTDCNNEAEDPLQRMKKAKAAGKLGIALVGLGGYAGGRTPEGDMNFPHINQQAKQMDAFALSLKNNKPTIVPGEMGRRDVKYINAIYEAMQSGKRITIPK